MNRLKKERTPVRANFTATANTLEEALRTNNVDFNKIKILMQQLSRKYQALEEIQNKIENLLLSEIPENPGEGDNDNEDDETEYSKEYKKAEEYRERYFNLNGEVDILVTEKVQNVVPAPPSSYGEYNPNVERRKVKLPPLNIKPFKGDLKDWLRFNGQFEKIDKDETISKVDKLHYLVECMEPDSPSEALISGFPFKEASYEKAYELLKNRYGRESLLTRMYVTKLLSLVLQNAQKGRMGNLTELFDQIEVNLRALDSIGKSRDKYQDFLEPLIEFCIPEELLKVWERQKDENEDASLDKLLTFIRKEVNVTEMINTSKKEFDIGLPRINKTRRNGNLPEEIPTAEGLANFKENPENCLFCDKSHPSANCYAAKKMTMENKKRVLLSKGACFICLKRRHLARDCKAKVNCTTCGNKRHLSIMCPDPKKEVQPISALANHATVGEVVLKTIVVRIECGSQSRLVRALIDDGSQSSYIKGSTAQFLNLEPKGQIVMKHGLFGGMITDPQKHTVYQVTLSSLDQTYRCKFDVQEVEKICGEIARFPAERFGRNFLQKGIILQNEKNHPQEIELLLGADVAGQILTGRIETIKDGLTAIETMLGWTVIGKLNKFKETESVMNALTLSMHLSSQPITKLWDLDVLGIENPDEIKNRGQDFLYSYQEHIKQSPTGRFQVDLPWKTTHPPLASNKEVAITRLATTRAKLQKMDKIEDYSLVLQDWLTDGITEQVLESEDKQECYYLPHRPIFKENSTTRIRPVFDASSHGKNAPSLNDCLETGPNLVELIPDILDRFRCRPVGVVADIEKAFLQIEVNPKDRDFLRYFDLKGDIHRHKRVVFGVTTSPFLLGVVLRVLIKKFEDVYPVTTQKLKNAMYVDNLVTSVDNKEELETLIQESVNVMQDGLFNLRGWSSNLESNLVEPTKTDLPLLGMIWNTTTDQLKLSTEHFGSVKEQVTKRMMLSAAQKVFDPIGIVCPLTLIPKILLQRLWNLKIGWDSNVPPDIHKKFTDWATQLKQIEQLRVERFVGNLHTAQLHTFVDSSSEAFAACVFIRTEEHGRARVHLMRAKSRVAPLQANLTIPRLELLACVIGVRLTETVKKALNLTEIEVYYWSDSMTALSWIKSKDNGTVFVKNRVNEIRKLTSGKDWRHVPGDLNPADLPSRGCTATKLLQSRWWEGPSWLYQESDWPLIKDDNFAEVDQETNLALLNKISGSESSFLDGLFSSSNDYYKIMRTLTWVCRFIHNCHKTSEKKLGPLTFNELQDSEKIAFRYLQEKHSIEEREPHLPQTLKDEDGLVRVVSKLVEGEDSKDFVYPIVLPGNSPLVRSLIRQIHEDRCHAGSQILFGILRERFWLLRARKMIKGVIKSCVKCQRFKAKPGNAATASLPLNRIREAVIFEVSGVDLAGPLYLKGKQKAYVVVFTCAVFRAVHFELITSLSTSAFIQALRRFIARRGRCRVLYSDNGSNFVGTVNELNQLDWELIQRETDTFRIDWKFNCPTAAWWGGFWERMVRTLKDLLKRTLGRAVLNYEDLNTVLCDCESVINSRPLTYLAEGDELVPLTPMLFLTPSPQCGNLDLDIIEGKELTRRAKYRLKLRKDLTGRFRKEYLGQLVQRCMDEKGQIEIKKGQVVLVGESGTKRVRWPLGVVTETIPGRDGVVRCVKVKLKNGVLTRPVQRLYPLEFDAACELPLAKPEEPAVDRTLDQVKPEDVIENCPIKTRVGRVVKAPTRYDLLGHHLYLYEPTRGLDS